ncbi:LIM and senescent cell antigen-like-containing domain 2 isoform X5, partial [Paramuricea clavata]
HFVCAKCEKPFYGHLHYEKNGLPYCETHYNELFGEVCFKCNHGIVGGEGVYPINQTFDNY